MRERPIIFNSEMVRAIIDGQKYQTRRVIKPQPADHYWEMFNGAEYPDGTKYKHHMNLIECDRGQFLHSWHTLGDHTDSSEECNQRILCPYGVPGDRLYVRETYGVKSPVFSDQDWYEYLYKADIEGIPKWEDFSWKPSIHMPKKAARIWLEVVDVRVERVQDITTDQIKSEGVRIPVAQGQWPLIPLTSKYFPHKMIRGTSPVTVDDYFRAFWVELWDSINAKRGYGWESNPWVWVVEFELLNNYGWRR